MTTKKLAGLLLCAGVATQASAHDLMSLYDEALTKDPTLQQAQATRKSQETLLPQARGALLPQITATVDQDATYTESATSSADVVHTHGAGLSLTQNILNFQAWYAYSFANKQVDSAIATYQAASQDLMLRVTSAYFEVLKAKDNLHFVSANLKTLAKELDQVKKRLEVGLVAKTDLHETQARYDAVLADKIQAVNDLADTRDALEQITGLPADNLSQLQPTIKLESPEPSNPNAWVDTAYKFNPTLESARLNVEAADENLSVNRAAHLPSISFVGSRGKSRLGTFSDRDSSTLDAWTANVELSVNVFSGGTLSAKSKQAYYDHEAAKAAYEKQRRSTEVGTKNAYRDVMTSIGRVKALKQAVISSQEALKAAKAAYDVGTRTSVDVLNSIADLYQNKRDYANARHAYVVNQLRLKQAAGTISRIDLEAINAWLQKSRADGHLPNPVV